MSDEVLWLADAQPVCIATAIGQKLATCAVADCGDWQVRYHAIAVCQEHMESAAIIAVLDKAAADTGTMPDGVVVPTRIVRAMRGVESRWCGLLVEDVEEQYDFAMAWMESHQNTVPQDGSMEVNHDVP